MIKPFGRIDFHSLVVAKELGLSERMARNRLKGLMEDEWLEMTNPSRRQHKINSPKGFSYIVAAKEQSGG